MLLIIVFGGGGNRIAFFKALLQQTAKTGIIGTAFGERVKKRSYYQYQI